MDRTLSYYLTGREEGIWLVLYALFKLESSETRKINREWVIRKLNDLMLNDFTDGILNTYLPLKEEK